MPDALRPISIKFEQSARLDLGRVSPQGAAIQEHGLRGRNQQVVLTMISHFVLSLAEAKTIADGARAEAERNGWNVVIAIVDDGGHLVYLERMDGTQKASCLVAQEKARSAIMFKRPTVALEKVVSDGRIAMTTLPNVVMVEGGLPIVHQGAFVGAIGVSGVQSSQDGLIAKAGLDTLPA
jgi:glc operon protein GlcG